jgi:hypothetical protein
LFFSRELIQPEKPKEHNFTWLLCNHEKYRNEMKTVGFTIWARAFSGMGAYIVKSGLCLTFWACAFLGMGAYIVESGLGL